MKRGDVHAETSADVVAAKEAGVTDAILGFARRGVSRVALQAHVAGPIVKFYAVADGRFFSWYSADGRSIAISEAEPALARVRRHTCGRSRGLRRRRRIPSPDAPVLIDLNDWPSFAPVRDTAAAAIAAYIDEKALNA